MQQNRGQQPPELAGPDGIVVFHSQGGQVISLEEELAEHLQGKHGHAQPQQGIDHPGIARRQLHAYHRLPVGGIRRGRVWGGRFVFGSGGRGIDTHNWMFRGFTRWCSVLMMAAMVSTASSRRSWALTTT